MSAAAPGSRLEDIQVACDAALLYSPNYLKYHMCKSSASGNLAMSMEKYDLELYDQLVSEQHSRFPSITLPPEYAELFQINTLQVLVKLARYKFVARLLRKDDDVLEVGSGTGLGAIFLSQHVRHVTGLEIKPHDHGAACATNRRDNVVFLLQSLFDYP